MYFAFGVLFAVRMAAIAANSIAHMHAHINCEPTKKTKKTKALDLSEVAAAATIAE